MWCLSDKQLSQANRLDQPAGVVLIMAGAAWQLVRVWQVDTLCGIKF